MSLILVLGIVAAAAILPLGVRVEYDSDGFRAKVVAGPVRIGLYPRPKKKKAEKKETKPAPPPGEDPEQPWPPEQSQPGERSDRTEGQPQTGQEGQKELPKPPQMPKAEKSGGSLTDFLPFVKLGLELMGDFFFRLLTFQNVYIRLVMAGEDKSNLAIGYGRTWAALGNLLPVLDNRFRIRKRDIQVGVDFEARETRIAAKADITVPLGGLLAMGIRYGVRGLAAFLNFKKKRKGGENHEPKTT